MVNAALWDLCPRLYFSQDFHSTICILWHQVFFFKLFISLVMGRQGTSSQKGSLDLGFSTKPILTNTWTMLPRHGQMFEFKQRAFYTPLPKTQSILWLTLYILFGQYLFICFVIVTSSISKQQNLNNHYPWFLFLTKLRKASCSLSFKVFSFVPVSVTSFIWSAFLRIESWKHTL